MNEATYLPRAVPAARLRRVVYEALDHPNHPGLLEALGSAYMTVRWRERCRLRRISAGWLHSYSEACVVRPRIGGFPPELLTQRTHDHFLHAYVPGAGDTIVDVGAGIGEETLTFARLVGRAGRVVAIEAHPTTFGRLQALVQRNRLGTVTALQLAIADRPGSVSISDFDHHLSNSIVQHGPGGISVEADTLDRVADEHGLRQIDFLKMNIEGAEELAIDGMGETIGHVRHTVIACHDIRARPGGPPSTLPVVRGFLESNGFDVLTRDEDPRRWTRNTLYGVNRRLG